MSTRIVIIGGGSVQWTPKLLVDIANTPSLHDAEVGLVDLDAVGAEDMAGWGREVARRRGIALRTRAEPDRRAALDGAEFVVVTISTGGFDSMRHDLDIPERFGIRQSVGDSVGPGGIVRALRNVPVLFDIARDMEERCPDAWLLNLTNPMTTLCRALTRETPIRTVGLCHEVTMTQFLLTQLLDCEFRDIELAVTGVNHFPVVTRLQIAGDDGFARLRALLADAEARGEEPVHMPAGLGHEVMSFGGRFRKRDLLTQHQVKFELFRRFGVLPAAGDRHLVEFFPGFLTEESEWGRRWGVGLTTIAEREVWVEFYEAELAQLRAASDVPSTPSGELVAPLVDALLRDRVRHYPLNLPNRGQCPDLPPDAVVESICTADGSGVRGRDTEHAPPFLAEWLRRVCASQEATVDAACSGRRDDVVEAMMLDPLAGRIDLDRLEQMTDEMLAATRPWLPQFS